MRADIRLSPACTGGTRVGVLRRQGWLVAAAQLLPQALILGNLLPLAAARSQRKHLQTE